MDSGTTPSAGSAAVVVLAGGIGSRMRAGTDGSADSPADSSADSSADSPTDSPVGTDSDQPTTSDQPTNKVYLTVGGREVLAYSLEAIDASDAVGLVVLVVRDGDQDHAADLLRRTVTRHPTRITEGGASRHESERAGIEAVAADVAAGTIGVIAVHDGARPFLTTRLLDDVLSAAAETGGAIAALGVGDMLYHCDDAAFVQPSGYAWAQTPQAFDGAALLAAHRRSGEADEECVDTAQVLERFGAQPVAVVDGDPANIKLTFRHDLDSAEHLATGPADAEPAARAECAAPSTGDAARPVAGPRPAVGSWLDAEPPVAVCHVAEETGTDRSQTTIWLRAGTLAADVRSLGDDVRTVAFVRAASGAGSGSPELGTSDVLDADLASALASVAAPPGETGEIDGVAFYRPPSSALKQTADGTIVRSIDRTLLRALCGPEVLDREALLAALDAISPDAVVNPAALVAAAGGRVAAHEAS